jgi:hypothetical protein
MLMLMVVLVRVPMLMVVLHARQCNVKWMPRVRRVARWSLHSTR